MHSVTRMLVLLAVVVTFVMGGATAAGVQDPATGSDSPYTIVQLDAPGAESSRAFGISEQGWVVGQANDADGRLRAVLWRDGKLDDLGALGGDEAAALNINEQGQIVGAATTAPDADMWETSTHAFLWQAGHMRDLGTLGGELSVAQGINAQGQVVGASTTAPGQPLSLLDDGPHAYLWEDGHMINLGTLGGARSWAAAINDAGQVVGTAQTADGEDHAFLWEDGVMTDLGTLSGDQAVAFAINRHGQVAGGSTTAAGQELGEPDGAPFRWEAGHMTTLGNMPGPAGIAYGINDRGGVVGADPEAGAVLWRGNETVALADVLPVDDGWEALNLARAINARGQIVGWGQRDGATRAFIASPATLGVAPDSGLPSSTPTAYIVGLEADEVVERAQRAIRDAGTYRFQRFSPDDVGGEPLRLGEVAIGRGNKTYAADGSDPKYYDGQTLYNLGEDGQWMARIPPYDMSESLLDSLGSSPPKWDLSGMETVNGRPTYVIGRTTQDTDVFTTTQTLWIDAATFLPLKEMWLTEMDEMEPFGSVTLFTDFGAEVDITPPPAALAPTPTPEPLPETSGGRITISLHNIYFQPAEVTIPANEDVLIVLPNEGAAVHNFAIDELGIISGNVAWGTTGSVVVNLPPGVYEFRCSIPGHTEAGQVGTLTVRD